MSDMRLDDDPLQGLVGNREAWAAEFEAVGEILDQMPLRPCTPLSPLDGPNPTLARTSILGGLCGRLGGVGDALRLARGPRHCRGVLRGWSGDMGGPAVTGRGERDTTNGGSCAG